MIEKHEEKSFAAVLARSVAWTTVEKWRMWFDLGRLAKAGLRAQGRQISFTWPMLNTVLSNHRTVHTRNPSACCLPTTGLRRLSMGQSAHPARIHLRHALAIICLIHSQPLVAERSRTCHSQDCLRLANSMLLRKDTKDAFRLPTSCCFTSFCAPEEP